MADGDGGSLFDTHRGPDPSLLTVASIQREILHLDRLLTFRIDSVEKAAVKANDDITKVPTDVDRQIKTLRELMDEKFKGVQQQLTDRDTALTAAFQAAKDAVTAQNQASEQAITKAETATTQEIAALKIISDTETRALQAQLSVLQQRIDRGEGVGVGTVSQRTEARAESAQRLQVSAFNMMVIAVAVSAIVSLAVHFLP